MNTRLLIDGYNLLFTSGMDGRGRGPGWLQRARERLLKFLTSKLSAEDLSTTLVVFDADRRPHRASPLDEFVSQDAKPSPGGIQVVYAVDYDEADDLLESIIRKHSAPKSLTVVSSDNRVRKCALARRAQSLDIDAFLTQLESSVTHDASPITPEVDQYQLSPDEVERWLREFGEAGDS